MIESLAQLLISFSIPTCLLLVVAQHTIYRHAEFDAMARLSGSVLLVGLAMLQWLHGAFLEAAAQSPGGSYRVLLFIVAPAFFIFFEGALRAHAGPRWNRLLLFVPAPAAAWMPDALAIPLAFAAGTIYAALLTRLALRLRTQRKRFRLEALAFAAHGLIALAVLLLGLLAVPLGLRPFVLGYAMLIGLGLLLALYTMLRFPDLAASTAEAVRAAYANSSLGSVDVDAAIARLDRLMRDEQAYVDETLSLSSLAERVGLGPHQLSELLNARMGIGFSRFLREHRVRAAQRMLLDEPRASVLSVGLAVGFTSQSNFYAAFREITGEVPGRFRRSQSA